MYIMHVCNKNELNRAIIDFIVCRMGVTVKANYELTTFFDSLLCIPKYRENEIQYVLWIRIVYQTLKLLPPMVAFASLIFEIQCKVMLELLLIQRSKKHREKLFRSDWILNSGST